MLSGRGIDGELKSKFWELTEKFWKSGAMNGHLRAIYFANEGESNGDGKSLSEMEGNNGKKLISTGDEGGEQVKSAFGICTDGQNGEDCQRNKNNTSVVLVGEDPYITSSITWKKLKSENGDQTGLVRSGQSYEGLFKNHIGKGNSGGEESKLNRLKIQHILTNPRGDDGMSDIMCPGIWDADRPSLKLLKNRCNNFRTGSASLESFSLIKFLKSDEARKYFKAEAGDGMGRGGEFLALLTLLDLGSGTLRNVYFDRAVRIFEKEVDKFKLSSLMNSDGKILYWKSAAQSDELDSISYHSGGMGTVRLCSNSSSCSNGNGLNLTLGDGKFCVVKDMCFSESDSRNSIHGGKDGGKQLINGAGLWTNVFGNKNGVKPSQAALISLVAASFDDIKNVSLSVQEPSKVGTVIFTQLSNEK